MAGPPAPPGTISVSPMQRRTDESDDDEERRPPPPSERRPGRPRRRRQDDARRAAPVQGRGDPAARARRRRDGPPRLRARGAEAPRVAEPRGRHVRGGRDADLAGRHARLPGLRRRRHRGLRRGRRRDLRDGRLRRRRGGPRAGRRAGARSTGTAACFFINKSDRENADPTAALDALRAAFGDKIAPLQLAIGAAESFERLRRPRPSQGLAAGTARKEVEIPIPDELDRRGRPPARPAARGGRRGRRRRPDQVPRGRGDHRPGARGLPAQGRQGQRSWRRSSSAARSRASACAACSTRSSATSPPRPTRPPVDGRRQVRRDGRGRGRRGRPAARPGLQDHRGPVRRPADLPARPVRARSTRRPTSGTPRRGEDERIGQLLLLHGKEQEPIGELKAGEIGAVAKLTVTETGDTLGARGEAADAAAARLPGSRR